MADSDEMGCIPAPCAKVLVIEERVTALSQSHEALEKRLNGNLERLTSETKQMRELISERFGEALDHRVDDRIKVDKAEHPAPPPPTPGWVPWVIGALSTVATGAVVYIVTH